MNQKDKQKDFKMIETGTTFDDEGNKKETFKEINSRQFLEKKMMNVFIDFGLDDNEIQETFETIDDLFIEIAEEELEEDFEELDSWNDEKVVLFSELFSDYIENNF